MAHRRHQEEDRGSEVGLDQDEADGEADDAEGETVRLAAAPCGRDTGGRGGRRARAGSVTLAIADGWIELTGSCSQRWVPATGAWKNAAASATQVTARSGSATFQLVSLSSGTKVAASIAAKPSSTATSCRKANSYSQRW